MPIRRSETLADLKLREERQKRKSMEMREINARLDAVQEARQAKTASEVNEPEPVKEVVKPVKQTLDSPKRNRAPPARRDFDPSQEPPPVIVPPIEEDARILLVTESSKGKIVSQPISAQRVLSSMSAPELRPPPNRELLKLSLALVAQSEHAIPGDAAELIATIPLVRSQPGRRKATPARLKPIDKPPAAEAKPPRLTVATPATAARNKAKASSSAARSGSDAGLNLLDERSVKQFRSNLNKELDKLSRLMRRSEPTLPTLARKVVPPRGKGKGAPKPLPHLKWEKYAAAEANKRVLVH